MRTSQALRKPTDIGRTARGRVSHAGKPNEAHDPGTVRLLGARTQIVRARHLVYAGEQPLPASHLRLAPTHA